MRRTLPSVFYWSFAAALPHVAFPFNSQVPTLGRVGKAYEFQLAATTFDSDSGEILSYALSDAPSWLGLDGATRTLHGYPGQSDSGPNVFKITAAGKDGSVDMSCTLVVTSNAAPSMSGNISEDLARSGTLSGPTTLLLQPSDVFAITFSSDIFQDSPGRIQAYYATMSDHTPLPSWIQFQDDGLAFWGITPVLATGSQTFTVDLIASDVVGFAGAVAAFTIVVTNNRLWFNAQEENRTITRGAPVTLGPYRDQLYLNGNRLSESAFANATADCPSWLTFNNDTLQFTGTAPSEFKAQAVYIVAKDTYGDTAVKTIYLKAATNPLFTGHIESLTATAGTAFAYSIPVSAFSEQDLNVTVDPGAATWLDFDTSTLQLHGTPPQDAQPSNLTVSITASSNTDSETQSFVIRLSAADGVIPIASTWTSQVSPTTTSTSSSSAAPRAAASKKNSTVGMAVGIVVGCLALLALLFACAMLLCRRRRRDPRDKARRLISRPTVLDRDREPMIAGENAMQRDLEEAVGSLIKHLPEEPPRPSTELSITSYVPVVPEHVLDARRARKSNHSIASSIGNAEATIRGDCNIPVWGRGSDTSHTPHDSYLAATELARKSSRGSNQRLSGFGKLSPRKRASRILRGSWQTPKYPESEIYSQGTVIRRPDRKSRMSGFFSFSGDRSSTGSLDTHGTGMSSTKLADFPAPTSRPFRGAPLTDPQKRCSIRVVSQSDSVTDPRPIAEKRQSFIRKRASSSYASPLFASSRRSSNLASYTAKGSLRGRKASLRQPTQGQSDVSRVSSYGIQPPARNPRRLASSVSGFTPSFPGITPSSIRNNSPTLPIATEGTDSGSTTMSNFDPVIKISSLSLRDAASVAAQFAISRHDRDWVYPDESSPTPPPSSLRYNSTREVKRRQWADRLNRNSRGDLRPPSPLRSHLRGVSAQGLQCRKERLRRQDEEKENLDGGGNRISKLVDNDTFSGVKRGRRSGILEAPRLSSFKARIDDTKEEDGWEDVVGSPLSTRKGRSVLGRVDSNSSAAKAFI